MNNSFISQDENEQSPTSIIDEHRLLTERIDAASHEIDVFFAAPANRTSSDISRIVAILEELRNVAQVHFQHEETLMTKCNFPGLSFHKRDHDYLLKSLIHFTSSLSHGTVPFGPDMGVNLRSWLTYHIKKYDDAYVGFMGSGRIEGHD